MLLATIVAACGALRAPAPLQSRRAVLGAAAAAVSPLIVLPPAPAFAEGEWADHSGAFNDDFFKDFTKTANGFAYKFVKKDVDGEKPQNMQKCFVHYAGYLLDGTKFDTSYKALGGEPFSFRLGKGKVISGWESVVGGMQVGQRVIVKIPNEFAYGDKSVGPIPPGADLVFYMELVKLGGIKGDKPRLMSQFD